MSLALVILRTLLRVIFVFAAGTTTAFYSPTTVRAEAGSILSITLGIIFGLVFREDNAVKIIRCIPQPRCIVLLLALAINISLQQPMRRVSRSGSRPCAAPEPAT